MKIYFTCTTAEFQVHKNKYFTIRDFLVEEGHILTRDWLGDTNQRLKMNIREVKDIKSIYKDSLKALRESDLVIVEDTVSNFSTGHQITLALQMRKPTLVLWSGKKHRQFSKMFIHGIDSEYLVIKEYTDENIKEIIKIFIEKYKSSEIKSRFNLVLKAHERNYLDWIQYTLHKSRTDFIRELLREKISKDKEYKRYLIGKS